MAFKIDAERLVLIILLAIILLGAGLRIYHLGDKSYWVDEDFSVRHSSLPVQEIIGNSENETNPPLYFLLLHFWMKIFGNSEFFVRLLSATFGIVSIFIMYHLGKLLFDKEAGLIASLILALSVFHIIHSQEARMYSLVVMLALLSMYFFLMLMKEKSIKYIIFYLISSILLAYTHFYGLFIILVQNVFVVSSLLFFKEKSSISLKRWVVIQLLIFLAFIPWIFVLVGQLMRIRSGEFVNINWLVSPPLSELLNTFLQYASSNFTSLALFSILSFVAIISLEKTGKKASLKTSHSRAQSRINLLLVLWLFIPILIPYIISKFVLPIYSPTYTIPASLAFYLLAAKGISIIRNRYAKGLLLALVIYLLLASAIHFFSFEWKPEPWREVAGFIDSSANKDDLVIVEPSYALDSFQWYSKRTDIMVSDGTGDAAKETGRTWFVLRNKDIDEQHKNFTPIIRKEFGIITVYLINRTG